VWVAREEKGGDTNKHCDKTRKKEKERKWIGWVAFGYHLFMSGKDKIN